MSSNEEVKSDAKNGVKSFSDRPDQFEKMGATTKCAKMLRLMGYTTGSLIQKFREESLNHHFKETKNKYEIRAEVYTDKAKDYWMTQEVVVQVDFVAPYINVDANAKKNEFLDAIKRARLWSDGCDMAIFNAIEEVMAEPKVYDVLDRLTLDPEKLAGFIFENLKGPAKDDFYVIRTMFKAWEEGINRKFYDERDVADILKKKYSKLESKQKGYEDLCRVLNSLTDKDNIKKFLGWVQKSLVCS